MKADKLKEIIKGINEQNEKYGFPTSPRKKKKKKKDSK